MATYLALPIAVFDAIITDSYLPDAAQTAIQQANITLHMTGE
ncbi:hypothetical protein GGER_16660 [Serratia rubidaea]